MDRQITELEAKIKVAGRNAFAESREDWLVVLTSAIGLAISVMYVYSMGVFIVPIETEFGWPRAQISAGLTVVSIVSVILAPFVGMSIDRWGSRRIALTGMAVYCSAFAALGSTTSSIWHWWALWALVAFGSVLIKPTVWMTAVTTRFSVRRGLAIGLALCGTGIGAAIMPSVTSALVNLFDWRPAFAILGFGGALIALPTMFFLLRDSTAVRPIVGAVPKQLTGLTINEGLRSSRFYRMAVASLLVSFGVIGLSVHFVPVLISYNVASQTAAGVAGAIGVSSIIGRVATGYVLDRVPGTLVGAIGFGLPVVACTLLLNFDGSTLVALACALILGLSLGAEVDVVAYLAGRYFGLRNYGMLFGSLVGLISLGIGTGSAFAGAMFDYFGSYDLLLWVLMPVFLVSAGLIGSLGRYPVFESADPHDELQQVEGKTQ